MPNSKMTKAQRDKVPAADFAGPNRSFPITDQAHLDAAAKLYSRADDPAKVKAAIIRIGKRKGLTLPQSWGTDSGKSADMMINFGGAVKAMGEGRVQGYLVTFGDPDTPDLSAFKDFFQKDASDFDIEAGEKRTVYFHHGLDGTMKTRKLGKVELSVDDVGVWVDGVLNMRDEYEKAVYDLAAKNKLSWSSGAATHLVRREKVEGKNAHLVTHWPIAEASLTPEPADYRNDVIAVKSADRCTLFADLLRDIEGAPHIEVKYADILGDLTPDICSAAFDLLSSRLSRFVYKELYDDEWGNCCYDSCGMDDDEDAEPIDRAAIEQALQRYMDTVLAVLDALMALQKPDETAVKALLAQFDTSGKSDVVTLLSALPIKSYLETMGAIVTDSHRRLTWYAEQREIKQGRAISSDNLAAMQTIRDGMKEAHSAMETHIASLDDMIERHTQQKSTVANKVPNNKIASEFARYLAIGAAGAGATVTL